MNRQTLGLTETGKARPYNYERYLVKEFLDGSVLAAVADGLGKAEASGLAVDMVTDSMAGFDPGAKEPESELERIISQADQAMWSRARSDKALEGMGSACTAVFLRQGGWVHWAHVGDSRLYHYSGGLFTRVSIDENLAQFAVDQGDLTPQQARGHILGNFLEQCVGCGECKVQTGRFLAKPGDFLLLCTDGLHNAVRDRDMADVLSWEAGLQSKAQALMRAAMADGGGDNATLALVEVGSGDSPGQAPA